MKKTLALLLTLCLCAGLIPAMAEATTQIVLSDEGITVDGQPISADPAAAVYAANDIVFYLEGQDFTYGKGTEADAHSQAEADAHTVVHITQSGSYEISGKLSAGQIAVELEDGKKDPDAVVTLILNNMDITCTVAPAVIFYNVYECSDDEEENATKDVDTSAAGANVIIADDSVNNVTGSYVARIYDPETVELNEEGTKVEEAKKLHKYDGAFYSKRTMNVSGGEKGNGVLNITADNEGLDSELHLTLNGGIVNIVAGNDGINTNEDNVSVTTINGGELNIVVAGWTGEGDGIDSNGWLVINGGKVSSAACATSMDAGIDSDMGIYLNGGSLVASGSMLDHIAGGEADYAVFSFSSRQTGGTTYTLRNADGKDVYTCTPANDFTVLVVSDPAITAGQYTLWMGDTQLGSTGANVMAFGGMPPEMPEGMEKPENMPKPPQGMELPEGFDPSQMTPPEGMEMPEGFDPSQMTPPDGMENMPQPPQGGFGGDQGEWSTDFEITQGGSLFGGVS